MSLSKKEEKLEPFTICREDSPGGQSLPPGVLFEQRQCLVYFRVTERSWCRGPLQHLVAQSPKGVRNGGWVLRASTKGQRSEWVTSPVGLVWFLVLFFSTYSHTSVQWELQVRLTRRSLSWWLHRGTARHQCNIEKRWKYQRQSLDDQESQWLMQSEQKDVIVVLSNGLYWWSG